MSETRRITRPTYTQVPNLLLDELLPEIATVAELKVVLAIARQTFGFHRDETRPLSLTRLSELTGLARQSVVTGAQAALERGLVEREQDGQSYVYSLVVQDLDQSKDWTTSSPEIGPPTRAGQTSALKETEKKTSGASEQASLLPSPLQEVWRHYQATVEGASRRTLDSTRVACIKRALKVRTVDECKRAIDGLEASPHHHGENDRRKTYLDIQYALGLKGESPDERIDKAIGWADQFGAPATADDAKAAWLRSMDDADRERLRLALADAAQPDDRGKEARRRLSARGIEIVFRDGFAVDWTYTPRGEAA